jgi:hypothetical protein
MILTVSLLNFVNIEGTKRLLILETVHSSPVLKLEYPVEKTFFYKNSIINVHQTSYWIVGGRELFSPFKSSSISNITGESYK